MRRIGFTGPSGRCVTRVFMDGPAATSSATAAHQSRVRLPSPSRRSSQEKGNVIPTSAIKGAAAARLSPTSMQATSPAVTQV